MLQHIATSQCCVACPPAAILTTRLACTYPPAHCLQVLEYGVSGIPHFVFLDSQGVPQAAAVGKLPPEVLLGDLDALAEGKPLPYARVRGQVSPMQRPGAVMAGPSNQVGPLDHF